jgi:hypothetical protein
VTTTSIGPLKPRPLGRAGGSVAVVGVPDAHAQRGYGDHAQPDEACQCVPHRVLPDVMGPAARHGVMRRLGDVRPAMDRQLVDLGAGQTEQTGQQRDRGDHRRGDDDRDCGAHRADGGNARQDEPEDGDHDGRAGEQHGHARCRVGGAGGVGDAHALVEVLAVAGDDEQGVVDADAEADHHAQDHREVGDVDDRGQDADAGGADEQAHQRGDDRQTHRDDGAERDEQHDDGERDADELTGRCVLLRLREVAGEVRLDTGGASDRRCPCGVVELGGREVVDRVGNVDVCGAAVGAHRGGLWSERIGDCGDVMTGRELLAGSLDRRLVAGVVDAAVVGVEHDARGLAALAGEVVLENVGGPLRFDAGDPDGVVVLAAGGTLQDDEGDGGHEPDPEHPERVTGAAATEAVEECAHGLPPGSGPPVAD